MNSAGSPPQPPPGSPARPTQPAPYFWTLGFLLLGAVAAGRVWIALDLAVEGRGAELELARFGLAARFLPEALNALVLGMAAAAVAALGAVRGGWTRGMRLGAAAFVVALLALALCGWPAADARDVPVLGAAPERGAGVLGLWAPLGLALGLAGLLLGAAHLVEARPRLARTLGSPGGIAVAALVGLGGPLVWPQLEARRAPRMHPPGYAPDPGLDPRAGWARSTADARRPNIVLVVVGNLGAAGLSCYGYRRPTTPHIDRLARRGLRFEEAFTAAPALEPALASLLTGLGAEEHGVGSAGTRALAPVHETLAEVLQAAGFTTGAFSGHPGLASALGSDQGFEHIDGAGRPRASDEFGEALLAWIDRHADVRFFLLAQLHDAYPPHRPLPSELARLGGGAPAAAPRAGEAGNPPLPSDYDPTMPTPEDETNGAGTPGFLAQRGEGLGAARELYDAAVSSADHLLGRVLERLERLGLTGSTLVGVTGDRGGPTLDPDLSRDRVRVPLILAGPGIPAGVRVAQPISSRHLAPTLARLGGTRLGAVADALDLAGELAGTPQRALFSIENGYWNGNGPEPLHGLREGRWVLHWNPLGRPAGAAPGAAPPGGEWRLFDASVDPGERHDVSLAEARWAEDLRRGLEREIGQRRARGAARLGAIGPAPLGGAAEELR